MRNVLVALGALVGAGLFLQCTSVKDLCMNEECQGYSKEVEAGPECDPVTDPVNCMTGVFLSNKGDDNNDGTQGSPVQTITRALALAKSNGLGNLLFCGGEYSSSVTLDAVSSAPISLFGGYDCNTWQYTGVATKINPSADSFSGPATLSIKGFTGRITISDLEIDAPNVAFKEGGTPREDGTSSIAIFVSNSKNVTLRRVTAVAGAGAGGGGGAEAKPGTVSNKVGDGAFTADKGSADGSGSASGRGGQPMQCTCSTGGSTSGGAGGNPGDSPAQPDGLPGKVYDSDGKEMSWDPPSPDSNFTGNGGTRDACIGSGAGANGYRGSDSTFPVINASSSSSSLGSLDDSGWHLGDGGNGPNGMPGQGGGGGGSVKIGGGGGGACGGCGGGGGGGGHGGGASVALLSFNSSVQLNGTCSLTASNAGAGGAGQQGASGAEGGMGGGSYSACKGGNGGKGSDGGAGSGGAGGISAAILYAGTAPTNTGGSNITLQSTAANPAMGGTGGASCLVDSSNCNDGPNGLVGKVVNAGTMVVEVP